MTFTTFAIATIRVRTRTGGSVRYTAQIRIKQDGAQVYQETQSFARKQAVKAWVKKRETELAQPGAIERANRQSATVKEMIERYLVEVEKVRPLGKTKRGTLAMISESYLGRLEDHQVTSQQLVDYALWRMAPEGGSVQPQTAGTRFPRPGPARRRCWPSTTCLFTICAMKASAVCSKWTGTSHG
jgi:hypothetical protein